MPRYYFDIDDNEKHSHDDEGIDLPDAEAARKAAIDILPNVARDELPDGNHHEFRSSVRDEAGHVVFRAKLSLDAEWVD